MKNYILNTITAFILIANLSVSMACDIHGHSGFMPENNLRISQFDKATNGMTEVKFKAITDRVANAYSSIIKLKGGTLVVNNLWTNDYVNANAERKADKWIVNMYGGLARHPMTTDDGFMLVMCHELGHHIGGAPRKFNNESWAANEGQADYFGAMKCMRRVLENDDNQTIVSKIAIDADAVTKCTLVYKSADDIALCERIAMAGKSLGNVLNDIGAKTKIDFTTPDKSIVQKTFDNHPEAQCRLDTYYNGILCDKSYDQDTDLTNPTIGVCNKRDGYTMGTRPLCWYKPNPSEI